ncbi:MAG: PACE efflux transporter [Parvibaculum sp.]
MRTIQDRIRLAVSFELIGLAIVIPLGTWVFDMPMADIGIVGVVSATAATLWNYVFGLIFDHAKLWLTGDVHKKLVARFIHASLFELGLLAILLPYIAWQLGISLVEAFLLDVSFALFYLIYAFVFNWLYDLIFPIPVEPSEIAAT